MIERNDFTNDQKKKDIYQTSSKEIYHQTSDEAMDIYKRRRSMASEFSRRKEYKTNQRLDNASSEPKVNVASSRM